MSTVREGVAVGAAGKASVVLAVVTAQVIAFGACYVAGVPTLYLAIAILSGALLGWRSDLGWFGLGVTALGVVLLLALGMPLALFVLRLQPDLVAEAALSPDVHRMLYLTIYGPLLAALVALFFGVPLAFLLARGFAGQAIVESLVDLPLVVPHSVAGILILFGFGRQGLFPSVSILSTTVGLVLALTFVASPYAVNGAREGFEAIDDRLEYAARSHGANPFESFRRVHVPLAARGILTGGLLAWARAVSEFGAVAVVAYSVRFFYPVAWQESVSQLAPVFIYNTYTSQGLAEAGAVSAILLLLSGAVFLVIRSIAYDDAWVGP